MRESLVEAMDKYQAQTKKQKILKRRGAFIFLPIYFDNDLVHGSWWLVAGSIAVVIFTAPILANSYDPTHSALGTDDSTLSQARFESVWWCILISGVFFTLGSLAFVRSMFEVPPKPPLLSWYHLSSDELLGSWCYFVGMLPAIPYSFIYIVAEKSATNLAYFAVSILLNVAAALFVRSCYPSQENEDRVKDYVKRWIRALTCGVVIRESTLEIHLNNDWLASNWISFWGNLLAAIICFWYLCSAASDNSALRMYVFGTGLIETICMLIGSAYWVAGSYPPEALSLLQSRDANAAAAITISSRVSTKDLDENDVNESLLGSTRI